MHCLLPCKFLTFVNGQSMLFHFDSNLSAAEGEFENSGKTWKRKLWHIVPNDKDTVSILKLQSNVVLLLVLKTVWTLSMIPSKYVLEIEVV
uniref:Uncharacterized protein n=1 Tax=Anser cygnoides TaxID=8845 RepID=A0A8B9D6Z3_ANSCY